MEKADSPPRSPPKERVSNPEAVFLQRQEAIFGRLLVNRVVYRTSVVGLIVVELINPEVLDARAVLMPILVLMLCLFWRVEVRVTNRELGAIDDELGARLGSGWEDAFIRTRFLRREAPGLKVLIFEPFIWAGAAVMVQLIKMLVVVR